VTTSPIAQLAPGAAPNVPMNAINQPPLRAGKSGTFWNVAQGSQSVLKGGPNDAPYRRLPAGQIEGAVLDQLRVLLQQPEIIVGTWRAAREEVPELDEDTVRDALRRFDPVWGELFPAEQDRLIRLLVQRVVVSPTGAEITLNLEGLASLARDISHQHGVTA
jgi:site-specific DNA recombinase